MPNNTFAASSEPARIILTILFAITTLAACTGGDISGTNTSPPANPPVAPAPGVSAYTLTVANSGGGIVTSQPAGIACGSTCSASFDTGQSVTLSAAASGGYSFTGWSGVCSGTGACTTTMSAARSVTAEFALNPTSGNAINLSLVAARTSGVAPLAVFFDASATTANATTRPFHDLEYRWNFGDATAGTWNNGARPGVSSKNSATGPVAAHVFETPGTYTVSLTATDGTYVATTSTSVTVQNPNDVFANGNTVCFSTSGTFTDCPAGAGHVPTSDFAAAINNYKASNRRLLFRRGETFTGASSGIINVNGPGIVGAYGTGAKPVVNGPGSAPVITLGTYGSGLYTDWRIMDLYLNGQNNQAGENVGINAVGQFNQVTILRADVVGTSSGYAASHWTLTSGQQSFDQWSIQDSTTAGIPNCNWSGHYICNWRVYVVGTRWSMQGNTLDNLGNPSTLYAGGSHVIRAEMLQNSVISNNTLRGAGDGQHDIKIHAWAWGGGAGGNATPGAYSEKIIIADNKIEGGANPWKVALGPQDEINDERVRDVILERNWFTANSRTQDHMRIFSSQTTIRNNICNLSGVTYATCVNVSRRGITPAPSDTHIYNNTFYSGTGTTEFVGVGIGGTAANTIVRNNLVSAPSSSNPLIISGTGTGLVSSNNGSSRNRVGKNRV